MTPGDNLFLEAIELIGTTAVPYYKCTDRTTNEIGFDVSTFAAPVDIEGSVQAVNRNVYQQLGLDFQKNYVMLYTANELQDIARDVSGDQIVFNGKRFQLTSEVNWYAIDGWISVLCLEIGNA